MHSRHKWIKIFFVSLSLSLTTLLFLEIPKIYYRYADQQLLNESSCSEYESQGTKDKEDFKEKAEKFLAYSSTKEPAYMEHSATITDEDMYDTVLKLAQELSLLLGGNSKAILEELLVGYKEAQGFSTEIIYGDDYWDVGFFEFTLPEIGVSGTILYDVASCKIFWFEWCFVTEDDQGAISVDESSILEYYEAMSSSEISFVHEPGYVLITPFSTEIMYEKLLGDLYEVREKCWGEIEVDARIGM